MKKLFNRKNTHQEIIFRIIASGYISRNTIISRFATEIKTNQATARKKLSWIVAQLETKGAVIIKWDGEKDLYVLAKAVKEVDGVWFIDKEMK